MYVTSLWNIGTEFVHPIGSITNLSAPNGVWNVDSVRGTPSRAISADTDDLVMAHLAAIDASKAEITALRCITQE